MATVTKNTDSWNVDVSPGEEMTLTMAQTYVDRDINIRAAAITVPVADNVTIQQNEDNSLSVIKGLTHIGTQEPTVESFEVWINPDESETITVANIKDNLTTTNSTWSSQKIKTEIAKGGGGGGVTYEAGPGIKIEDGIISCTFADGTEVEY